MEQGERYRNRYTGEIVTIKEIESVRVGPGETHEDVVVLEDGSRWQIRGSAGFDACFKPA